MGFKKKTHSISLAVIFTIVAPIIIISCHMYNLGYRNGLDSGKTEVTESYSEMESSISVQEKETAPLETLMPYASPVSGTISIGQPYDGPEDSEITVHASYRDCVVKLKTAEGKAVLSFFVRAGETATVGVPPKVLYAYFAEGDQWYGWSNYFGADTSYSMDPDPIDFSNYTIEYTLQMVSNGNLSLDHISASDF